MTPGLTEKKLYVYYDERYPYSWIPHNVAKHISKELEKYDFEVIDAPSLQRVLGEGSKDTNKEYVVVFAQDVVPDLVLDNPDNPTSNSLLRRFLNAGQIIVWMGDSPQYVGRADDNQKLNPPVMQNVLSMNPNYITTNKRISLTISGIVLSLPLWVGTKPHNKTPPHGVSGVSINPLAVAIDNVQYAHAFIISYKQSASGFVRIYDFPINKEELVTKQFIRGILGVATRDVTTPIWNKIEILSEEVNKIDEKFDTKFNTLKSEIDTFKTTINEILKLEKEILEVIQKKCENKE
ncbi:hypothetical protein [Methanocaldococcus jannaschii]|nr:hypothetical protein [Methanocaldococcus jannaschii]